MSNHVHKSHHKVPTLDVFFLWTLITPDIHVDIPFLLAVFLSIQAGKDRRVYPLYGKILITWIARSFGILDKRKAMFLTIELQTTCSPLLYKRAHIVVDNGLGNFSIPNDTPRNQPRRRVRPRGGEADKDEPPMIPIEDELPVDPYNMALRQFQVNLARGVNYTNMSLHFMM
ncbi:unnamed protein product [Lactuca virosa]|uniref:Uncharacterized protein n=1 Tax=Lactuca virosa TaxID=75947 RepID=A0AAU9NQP4_9ASTR|nr:unnamed protein product [Lactuca virosa]